MEIKIRLKCTSCNSFLVSIFDMGKLPLSNALLSENDLGTSIDKKYPLSLSLCSNCGLVQLGQIVSPKIMFENYLYIPSMSMTLLTHFNKLCSRVCEFRGKSGFIIDIGSNDGSLLKFFKQNNYKVLGIDPAFEIAKTASLSGVKTLPIMFNSKQAKNIISVFGKADVVTGTNVFAHIENLKDLYLGIDLLLKDDGVCVFEVSYLLDMIRGVLFDSIYHEHLYYFSIESLMMLFKDLPLQIFNIDRIPMHGGSLRVWLKKKSNTRIKVLKTKILNLLLEEQKYQLRNPKIYRVFKANILKVKNITISKLNKLRKLNKKIVAFGAPAKGNVLMNYFGIDKKTIEYVVDSTSYKQFHYTPGNHLQILPEETIYINKPDYLLVLAWNFADEIVKKHPLFKKHFIIPLPVFKII
jgi:hypothetical protein